MEIKHTIDGISINDSRICIVKVTDILNLMLFRRFLCRSEDQAIKDFKEKLYNVLSSDAISFDNSKPLFCPEEHQTIKNIKKKIYKLLSSERVSQATPSPQSPGNLKRKHFSERQTIIKRKWRRFRKLMRMLKNKFRSLIDTFTGTLKLLPKARKKKLLKVPLDLCTNQYAFSFDSSGWHYWKDIVLSSANTNASIEKHSWYRFIKNVSQDSYTKLMTFHNHKLYGTIKEIPFGSFPWGPWVLKAKVDPYNFLDETFVREQQNFMWFENNQAVEDVCIEEYGHTMSILYNILAHGYDILKYGSVPTVKLLQKKDADIRFVSHDGAHRLGVIAALGFDHAIVELDLEQFPVVCEVDVKKWAYVEGGLINKSDALKLFDLYFKSNGTERIRNYYYQFEAADSPT